MSDLWLVDGPAGGVVLISATAYTLRESDNNLTLAFTANSDVTVTAANDICARGFSATIIQLGLGRVTLAVGDRVTVNNLYGQTVTAGRYAVIYVDATRTNNLIVSGAVPASGGGGSGAVIQYETPITGQTIAADPCLDFPTSRLVLTPAGTLATLTVDMSLIDPIDGGIFELMTTQQITALTANGETFLLNANSGASWLYRAATLTWYARY